MHPTRFDPVPADKSFHRRSGELGTLSGLGDRDQSQSAQVHLAGGVRASAIEEQLGLADASIRSERVIQSAVEHSLTVPALSVQDRQNVLGYSAAQCVAGVSLEECANLGVGQ